MYPYHNRNIQRIKNGELIDIQKGQGEYKIILVFKTHPFTRPIKEKSLYRYKQYINIEKYK